LTHGVMNKELKACNNPEDLECNENVKHKTKEYIKKYMQRFGSVYRPKEDTEVY
ncbi:Histone-lysine N-methyltransferase setd2, partial [Goodea atripinnis]